MPNGRPRREDIPAETDPRDVLFELRQLDYRVERFFEEFKAYRAEINGDHAWLRNHRTRMCEVSRIFFVVVPVVLAAAIGLHLSGT